MGNLREGKYAAEKKFTVVGPDQNGDFLALVFLVTWRNRDPQKWIFDLITVFPMQEEEAGSPAFPIFALLQSYCESGRTVYLRLQQRDRRDRP